MNFELTNCDGNHKCDGNGKSHDSYKCCTHIYSCRAYKENERKREEMKREDNKCKAKNSDWMRANGIHIASAMQTKYAHKIKTGNIH